MRAKVIAIFIMSVLSIPLIIPNTHAFIIPPFIGGFEAPSTVYPSQDFYLNVTVNDLNGNNSFVNASISLPGGLKYSWRPIDDRQNCLLYLPFEWSPQDWSDYGNDGVVCGAGWSQGRFGGALSFDGVDDWVEVADSPSLNLSGQGAIEAWIRSNVSSMSGEMYRGIVVKASQGNPASISYGLDWYSPNALRGVISNGTHLDFVDVGMPLNTSHWYHVVFTWDGSRLRLYVDGQLASMSPQTVNAQATSCPLYVGRAWNTSQVWDGSIDEVRLYNRSLTAEEVQEHFDSRAYWLETVDWFGFGEVHVLHCMRTVLNSTAIKLSFCINLSWNYSEGFKDVYGEVFDSSNFRGSASVYQLINFQHGLHDLWVQVNDHNSDLPVANANVYIANSTWVSKTLKTNSSGYACFGALSEGIYNVYVNAIGYYDNSSIVLLDKTKIEEIYIVAIPVTPVFNLTILAIDSMNGNPVENVYVRLLNSTWASDVLFTNSFGYATFTNINRGEYILSINKDGYHTQSFIIYLNQTKIETVSLSAQIWWMQWWFWAVITFITLVAAGFIVFVKRTKKVKLISEVKAGTLSGDVHEFLNMRLDRKEVSRDSGIILAFLFLLIIIIISMFIYYRDFLSLYTFIQLSEMEILPVIVIIFFVYTAFVKHRLIIDALMFHQNLEGINNIATGFFVGFLAFIIYFLGSYTLYSLEFHILSLIVLISALILLFYGPNVLRIFIVPISTLALFLLPSLLPLNELGVELSFVTATIAYNIANMFLPISLTFTQGFLTIVVPSNTGEISSFVIGAPCAGVYSILAFSLFAGLLIYITHGKNYQKIMIVLTGLILVYILNVFRLVSLVTIAYFLGSGTAWQTFHFLGGSILFVIGLVVTLLLSDKIGLKLKTRIKQRKPCLFCEDAIQKNEKFCLTCGKVFQPPETKIRVNIFAIKIAAVILIVFLIVTITMPLLITQETPEGPLIIKSQKGSQPLLPSSEGWAPTYRGKLILDFPRMVVYNYYYSQSGKPNLVLVRLDVTTGEYPLHGVNTWPICTGWSLEMMKDIMLYGIQVPARFFALYDSSSGTQNVVLCWIKKLTDAPKYMRVNLYTDTRRLVQYGLISNYNDYDKAFSVLLDLARSIEQYWQNATQASFISKLFLENWPIWLALSVALIWLICYINWTRSKLEEERRTIKFEKLSEYEKQVYREIKNCSPSSNLLKIYLENRIRLVKFQETLKKLQEENLIGTDILVKDDIFLETIYPKPIKNE